MKTIQQFQIRKIYAIGHTLGIVGSGSGEDELHALVGGMTGKGSVKALTYAEASQVIARLEGLQGEKASPKPIGKRNGEHREQPGGVTNGQQKKIWALMYELKRYDEVANDVTLGERLCKIIKKELKIDAMAKDPFVWMDFTQGDKLIEILKKYIGSAKRKKRGGADGIDAG